MKIFLDPGHGGADPGAVAHGVAEEDITLAVALELAPLLREKGHDVLLARSRDEGVSINDRLKMIREYRPDAAISLHCNAALTPAATGVEVIIADGYDLPLAQHLLDALVKHTGLRSRGIKSETETPHKKLGVLRDLMTPAVLVELGFLTNEADLQLLKKTQVLCDAIIDGLEAWS